MSELVLTAGSAALALALFCWSILPRRGRDSVVEPILDDDLKEIVNCAVAAWLGWKVTGDVIKKREAINMMNLVLHQRGPEATWRYAQTLKGGLDLITYMNWLKRN